MTNVRMEEYQFGSLWYAEAGDCFGEGSSPVGAAVSLLLDVADNAAGLGGQWAFVLSEVRATLDALKDAHPTLDTLATWEEFGRAAAELGLG